MSGVRIVLILFLGLVSPAVSLAQDGHADEVKLSAEAIKRNGIVVEPAARQVLVPTISAPARVAFNGNAMAHVGSALRGRIVEMKVNVGDTVQKGDVLLVIHSPDLAQAQSDFLLKRTEAEAAGVAVGPAKQAYERAEGLHQRSEGIALAEVQRREAEWRAVEAKLTAAKAMAMAAENTLLAMGMDRAAIDALAKTGQIVAQFSVMAPIAGQVIEREVTLGELVNPDRDALLILADLSTLWVVADVTEARLVEVAIGAGARVEIAALRGQRFEGKVTHIAAALDPTIRTAAVRIEIPGSEKLRAGMFARAQINSASGESEAVLAVPESAVLSVEGQMSVFVPVADEENTFTPKPVKVGKVVGGMLPVLEGISEGQPVVTQGAFILKAELGKSGVEHAH